RAEDGAETSRRRRHPLQVPGVRQLSQGLAPPHRAQDVDRLADVPDDFREGHLRRRCQRHAEAPRERRAAEDARALAPFRAIPMTIKVALHHKTLYTFDRPVALSPHEVRLRPAAHCRTPIDSYSLN